MASGSTGSTSRTAGATSGSGAGQQPLTASDVGITPKTIKIGIALLTLGAASSFVKVGGTDPEQERKAWQAFIDEINKSGGVLGRQIEPYFVTSDVSDNNSQRAACTTLTETHHVFAIFAGATGMPAECVALQHKTLGFFSSTAASAKTVRASKGLLVSVTPFAARILGDWARALEHLGRLKGRKLGVVVNQSMKPLTDEGLVPVLKSMGYKVTYTAVLSDGQDQISQASTQAPQMQAAGVDTVFDVTGFAAMAAFVNSADKQQWHPQYMVNDILGNTVGTFWTGMPDSWNGTIAITYNSFFPRAGSPEDPLKKDCRLRYNKITGSTMQRDDASISQVLYSCAFMGLFSTAARKTGPNLTRAGASAVIQSLGAYKTLPGLGGSFAPGKTDWADTVRPMVWAKNDGSTNNQNCESNNQRCFNDAGPAFRPAA